ncbi:MAG TPA: Holliday junction resolvase RuvX, partial [Aestuariivirga sp.]|nr:Holliday junction resolvase RuvX [Aestuariivirga sp.]
MPAADLSLTEAVASLAPQSRLMGLDLGAKTIGVATGDLTRQIATPVETIARKKFTADAARLLELVARENIGLIVLGLPINMDGS